MLANILITSAGRRVSLLKAFQKELSSRFKGSEVYAADYDPELAPACHVASKSFRVPKISDASYCTELLEICRAQDIRLVIPTLDSELMIMAENAEEFKKHGIQIIISAPEFVQVCRDKRSVNTFFQSRGIEIIREYSKQDYKLPLFIKPLDGSGAANTHIVFSDNQISQHQLQDVNLMFLQYIDKKEYDEFTLDLYYDKAGKLRCVVPRKRLEVREGEVSKGVTCRNSLIPFIKAKLGEIRGVRGCITLQLFKEKTGEHIAGIEINPRFGGGYPLSYLAGANYPAWIIQEYLLDEVLDDQFDCWEEDLLLLRYDDEILSHGFKG
ncbi:MAG: ATP-grasp domain-containing protein [Flavobacteriaceae bacterium]|nr:ATP-grasp domain-containing protein [Bacteroidia bacterium]NNK87215.1 ATP-grasp domain-containing protein [Flavobacteriaceae bacterium]